jgi:hypothetical protein
VKPISASPLLNSEKHLKPSLVDEVRDCLRIGPAGDALAMFKESIDTILQSASDVPSSEQSFLSVIDSLAKERFSDHLLNESASGGIDVVIDLGRTAYRRYRSARSTK